MPRKPCTVCAGSSAGQIGVGRTSQLATLRMMIGKGSLEGCIPFQHVHPPARGIQQHMKSSDGSMLSVFCAVAGSTASTTLRRRLATYLPRNQVTQPEMCRRQAVTMLQRWCLLQTRPSSRVGPAATSAAPSARLRSMPERSAADRGPPGSRLLGETQANSPHRAPFHTSFQLPQRIPCIPSPALYALSTTAVCRQGCSHHV